MFGLGFDAEKVGQQQRQSRSRSVEGGCLVQGGRGQNVNRIKANGLRESKNYSNTQTAIRTETFLLCTGSELQQPSDHADHVINKYRGL